MTHTLIFDIGKTNKKCFLFDEKYQEVWKEYVRFDETKDEDGHLCDNIEAIENWMVSTFQKVISLDQYDIKAVNFSTYGASFIHVNKKGRPVAPLYNYLKPFPKDILDQFYDKYGSEMSLAKETASPPLQMLNSGLQLYYLKYAKPEIFKKIRWSLHLPQYLSFIFNRKPVSEFTSIGCHTMLWNYSKNDYHRWVYKEGIDKILPPIVRDENSIDYTYEGKKLKMGFGIHVEKLRSHYAKEEGYHRTMKFDDQLFYALKKTPKKYFKLDSIDNSSNELTQTDLSKLKRIS